MWCVACFRRTMRSILRGLRSTAKKWQHSSVCGLAWWGHEHNHTRAHLWWRRWSSCTVAINHQFCNLSSAVWRGGVFNRFQFPQKCTRAPRTQSLATSNDATVASDGVCECVCDFISRQTFHFRMKWPKVWLKCHALVEIFFNHFRSTVTSTQILDVGGISVDFLVLCSRRCMRNQLD